MHETYRCYVLQVLDCIYESNVTFFILRNFVYYRLLERDRVISNRIVRNYCRRIGLKYIRTKVSVNIRPILGTKRFRVLLSVYIAYLRFVSNSSFISANDLHKVEIPSISYLYNS